MVARFRQAATNLDGCAALGVCARFIRSIARNTALVVATAPIGDVRWRCMLRTLLLTY